MVHQVKKVSSATGAGVRLCAHTDSNVWAPETQAPPLTCAHALTRALRATCGIGARDVAPRGRDDAQAYARWLLGEDGGCIFEGEALRVGRRGEERTGETFPAAPKDTALAARRPSRPSTVSVRRGP